MSDKLADWAAKASAFPFPTGVSVADLATGATKPEDQTDTPDGMVRMHVLQNFTLNRGRGEVRTTFTITGTNCGLPGFYDMTPEDAEHWYTKAHCEGAPEPEPPMPGSPRAAEEILEQKHADALVEAAAIQARNAQTEQQRRKKQREIGAKLGQSFQAT